MARKAGFSKYVASVLQNSMLTGVPQIAAAGNWPKKLTRTLVFVLCVGGFIYQSLTFMWIYWEYQVVVDVQITHLFFDHRPSFTVCTETGFRSQEFCSDPEAEPLIEELNLYCRRFDDENYEKKIISRAPWCKCNPRLCDEQGRFLNLSFLTNYGKLLAIPRERYQKWQIRGVDMCNYCWERRMTDVPEEEDQEVECDFDYVVEVPILTDFTLPTACFTMNSRVGRPNHTLEKVMTTGEFTIKIHRYNEKFFPEEFKFGFFYISFHNPDFILNPQKDGFVLIPETSYVFHLKKEIRKLLPHPYVTDCRDYQAEWKANGYKGPLNLKDCINECQVKTSMEILGCIAHDLFILGDYPLCDKYNYKTVNIEVNECIKTECRPACYDESYIVREDVMKSNYEECVSPYDFTQFKDNVIHVRLDGMETTIYEYTPKYQDIETFSYLGGYVGMWLGISLVAVFDFVETVIAMLKYPVKRCLRFRDRRRKIDKIRRLQRNL